MKVCYMEFPTIVLCKMDKYCNQFKSSRDSALSCTLNQRSVILPEKIMGGSLFDDQNLFQDSFRALLHVYGSLPRFVEVSLCSYQLFIQQFLAGVQKSSSIQFMIFKYQNSEQTQAQPSHHVETC